MNQQSWQLDKDVFTEHLQKVLNIAGIEAEVLDLNREDGFDEGVSFELSDGTALIIGFPQDGIQNGIPFLLSTLSSESIVLISDDGTISIINGDNGFVSEGVLDVVQCLLNRIGRFRGTLRDCLFSLDISCLITSALQIAIDVLQCVSNFSE